MAPEGRGKWVRPRWGRLGVGAVVFVIVVGAGLAVGCAQERDPRKPLTADEGAQLLREIREDRTRLSDLTPAERQYLLRTLKR